MRVSKNPQAYSIGFEQPLVEQTIKPFKKGAGTEWVSFHLTHLLCILSTFPLDVSSPLSTTPFHTFLRLVAIVVLIVLVSLTCSQY